MNASKIPATLSANEAACVTGVPLKNVHRIIDTGLLGVPRHGAENPAQFEATAC